MSDSLLIRSSQSSNLYVFAIDSPCILASGLDSLFETLANESLVKGFFLSLWSLGPWILA